MRTIAVVILAVGLVAAGTIRDPEVALSATAKELVVSRQGWGAREAKDTETMSGPVPYVVIHHTYQPGACHNETDCPAAVRSIQDFHMDDRGWWDIGYSFAVGGDGKAYEGRGWSRRGAHAPPYNDKSIGICAIGDFRFELPPKQQLESIKKLIQLGVERGYISRKYKLIGHRQAKATECPGQALYDEISKWPQYSPDIKPHKETNKI